MRGDEMMNFEILLGIIFLLIGRDEKDVYSPNI